MTVRRAAALLAGAAGIGLLIFAVMVWRAVDTEFVDAATAEPRFDEVRSRFAGRPSALVRRADGTFARRPGLEPAATRGVVTRLHVWSYRASSGRLARADVAFWFYRLKAPAAQWAVRDTGFDLDDLGLTADGLAALGPFLLVDETTASGDFLLIWTE